MGLGSTMRKSGRTLNRVMFFTVISGVLLAYLACNGSSKTNSSAGTKDDSPIPMVDTRHEGGRSDDDNENQIRKYECPKVANGSAAGSTWYTFFGGANVDQPNAASVSRCGGYVLAGYGVDTPTIDGKVPVNPNSGGRDFLVVKLDAAGSLEWYTYLGSAAADIAYAVTQAQDNGYLVTGEAFANIPNIGTLTPLFPYSGFRDIFVAKLDPSGNLVWYSFFGSALSNDEARAIADDAKGDIYIAGGTSGQISNVPGLNPLLPYSGSMDIFILKLNAQGFPIWHTYFAGPNWDYAQSIAVVQSNGIAITGSSATKLPNLGGQAPLNPPSSAPNNFDFFAARIDSSGQLLWYTYIGSDSDDIGFSIVPTADGGFFAGGVAYADIPNIGTKSPINGYSGGQDNLLIKLSAAGALEWYTFLGGTSDERPASVAQLSDGGYAIASSAQFYTPVIGAITPQYGTSDLRYPFMISKLMPNGNLQWYSYFGLSTIATVQSPAFITGTANGGIFFSGKADNLSNIYGRAPILGHSGLGDFFAAQLTISGTID